jgi:hypothetical protein
MANEPFFQIEGTHYVPTPAARGPWNPNSLHGRVIAGLLGAEIERLHGSPDFIPARLTVDMYRLPDLSPVEVTTTVVRAGNRIRVIDAEFISGGVSAGRATCQLLKRTENPTGAMSERREPWNVQPARRHPPPTDARAGMGGIAEHGRSRAASACSQPRSQDVDARGPRRLVEAEPLTPFSPRGGLAADIVTRSPASDPATGPTVHQLRRHGLSTCEPVDGLGRLRGDQSARPMGGDRRMLPLRQGGGARSAPRPASRCPAADGAEPRSGQLSGEGRSRSHSRPPALYAYAPDGWCAAGRAQPAQLAPASKATVRHAASCPRYRMYAMLRSGPEAPLGSTPMPFTELFAGALGLSLAGACSAREGDNALDAYVAKPDPAFGWEGGSSQVSRARLPRRGAGADQPDLADAPRRSVTARSGSTG